MQTTCQLSSWHAAHTQVLAAGNPKLSLPTFQTCLCKSSYGKNLHQFDVVKLLPVCVCTGVGSIDIDTSTVTTTPYVLHYTAEDALGNIAVPVSRTVSVYNPCTPQAYCTASGELPMPVVWTTTHI